MRTSSELAAACRADGEFCLAARYWTGGLRLDFGDAAAAIILDDGAATSTPDRSESSGSAEGWITLRADRALWEKLLAPVPPPCHNDIAPARARGLTVEGDDLLFWQYGPAIQRAVELMRAPGPAPDPMPDRRYDPGAFDAPVGRYVHLELDGHDHRVYFEEAGTGIPVLCQHTAGSHSAQWRHLFEEPAITDRFRLIAYDLPFHGKSVPPQSRAWWTERYELTGAFVRSVPVALAAALDLDRPVFMGCSVGGLLALDLALHHPEVFRAVISLEGALRVGGNRDALRGFWHPGVSNESKARMMEGLTWPLSPTPFRKETAQTYAAGWPPAFLGDLQYYVDEYDLRPTAGSIDTSRVGVHILSGEYDYSATPDHGRTAHEAIAGSTFAVMDGLGHFPMSEHPQKFLTYLLPVLDAISSTG